MNVSKLDEKIKHEKQFQDYFFSLPKENSCSFNGKKSYYLKCLDAEIGLKIKEIKNFLNNNKGILLIPLKEKKLTIRQLLIYLEKNFPNLSILIINDESGDEVKKAVLKFKNILLVDKEEILRIINWSKLLPVLNLKKYPKGKGTTIMAGCLFLSLFEQKEDFWLFQTDADIENPDRFQPLEYLIYGVLSCPQALQIKIAQGGRNNEANMAVRSSLIMLEEIKKVVNLPEGKLLSQRAKDLFEKLIKYKWILGGTFALTGRVALERPFASGYLEEVLICAFVEDLAKKEKKATVQISNLNYCQDSPNDFKKENTIIQMTSNFFFTLLLARKSVCDWKIDDIAWINKNLLSKEKPIVLIPPKQDQQEVIVELVPQERIFPSIKMLFGNDLIFAERARDLKEKYIDWFKK